jgi:hypothetical protein
MAMGPFAGDWIMLHRMAGEPALVVFSALALNGVLEKFKPAFGLAARHCPGICWKPFALKTD